MSKVLRIISVAATIALAVTALAVYTRPVPVQAGGETVGFVNSDMILDNFEPAKTVNAQLADLRRQNEDQLEKDVRDKFGSGDVSTLPRESQMEIRKMIEQAEDDFQAQSESLRNERWLPIVDKVNEVIGVVAQEEQLEVVLEQSSVIYGGVDLTDKVIEKLKEK